MEPAAPPAPKVDLRGTLDHYRCDLGKFRTLTVPPARYLMIDGHGDPNTSPAFSEAVRALYPVAYTVKFASKQRLSRDYVVPPLEGLWWAADMDAFTSARDKSQWDWSLMLLIPDWVDGEMVLSSLDVVAAKKNRPARLGDVRVGEMDEGLCVQTLHVGPFDAEAEVLHRMHHEIIPGQGFEPAGTHHEIYLSDFRRVAPDAQRTILRQPVRPIRNRGR